MENNFTERQVLNSKTPEQYIDRCLNSKIKRGRKIALAKEWMEKTGHTVEDIKHARHRHPYWKKKKQEGYQVRNMARWSEFDYTEDRGHGIAWPDKDIKKFLEVDVKDKNGKYIHCDRELAKMFETTIPSIQHMRRKRNLIFKIRKTKRVSKAFIELMKRCEAHLRELSRRG